MDSSNAQLDFDAVADISAAEVCRVSNHGDEQRKAVIKEKVHLIGRLRKSSHDRTRIGSPKIRESFTAEDIDLFNTVNDGFPLPLIDTGQSGSNDDVFKDVKEKPSPVTAETRTRTRSLPEISHLKVNKTVKGAFKPTFFQKLLPKAWKPGSKAKQKNGGWQQKITDPTGAATENNRHSEINEDQASGHSKSVGTPRPCLDRNSCGGLANSNVVTKSVSADKGDNFEVKNDTGVESYVTDQSDLPRSSAEGDNSWLQHDSRGDNRNSSSTIRKSSAPSSVTNKMEFNCDKPSRRKSSSGSSNGKAKRSSSARRSKSGNDMLFSNDHVYDNRCFKRSHHYESIDKDDEHRESTSSHGTEYENVEFGNRSRSNLVNSCLTQSVIEFEWDSDSFSDFSDQSDGEDSSESRSSKTDSRISQATSKCHRVALEILSTEQAYVDKLRLLDQDFRFKIDLENRANPMFDHNVVAQMFSNINSLYHLHTEHLLPPLEERLLKWSENECIGDIMLTIGPFLKMYTEYIKNFDQSMYLIDLYLEKSRRFAALLDDIQKSSDCGMLTLQHHMLEPIQRVPRYELLMKDYLKHLPEDSPDKAVSERALDLITKAATHANEAMRKIEKFRKLLEINEQLGNDINIITPTRELIKEGAVKKVSAKNGDLFDRYLFLFNDMLLVCTIQGKKSYKMRARLDVDGMVARNGDDEDVPNTFHVQTKNKVFQFVTDSLEESGLWQVAIWRCVSELLRRHESFSVQQTNSEFLPEDDLGKRMPAFLKDSSMTVCMLCNKTFTPLRRKHNCRACGIIVCGSCSNQKMELKYDDYRPNRVCKKCFKILRERQESASHSEDDLDALKEVGKKGVLHVKADDPSILSGYLLVSVNRGRSWEKRWISIHHSFVMYSFKTDQDMSAILSTPLPGHQVSPPDGGDGIQQEHVFKLFHKDILSFYQAPDSASLDRWLTVLGYVVKAELPPCGDEQSEDEDTNL